MSDTASIQSTSTVSSLKALLPKKKSSDKKTKDRTPPPPLSSEAIEKKARRMEALAHYAALR
ncbi:hypothetical protein HRR83_003778 [Exophiala dermatitidis]|nr:hypothetical protein HRR83_003778 [Exophiala dermatitidis]